MLKGKIVREIREKDFITFDRFVEICLYDREEGYYTKKRTGNRPGEDFVTAPEVSEAFGKTLAAYLERRAGQLSLPLNILELGGGKGFLARDITEALDVDSYTVVEKRGKPHWLKEIEWKGKLEEVPPFDGIVISNEFFDAFPFKRIRKLDNNLFEVVIREKGGTLYEDLIPYRNSLPCHIDNGKEYALFVGWENFLEQLSSRLKRGLLVTFDYGGRCSEISGRMSFRAFRKNKLDDSYLEHLGKTDLTALVDFDYLSMLLEKTGFRVEKFSPQSTFLLENGLEKFLKPENVLQAITLLVDMGRKFKFLEATRFHNR